MISHEVDNITALVLDKILLRLYFELEASSNGLIAFEQNWLKRIVGLLEDPHYHLQIYNSKKSLLVQSGPA